MKKNRAQKDILYISISTFVLSAMWIGFNLFHSYTASTIAPDLQLQIVPIDPTFNSNLIQKIKSRKKVSPVYELAGEASSEATISQPPINTDTPTSSLSGVPATPSSIIPRAGQ